MDEHKRIRLMEQDGVVQRVMFYCPGCDMPHGIKPNAPVGPDSSGWSWNNCHKRPTFSPSVLVEYEFGESKRPKKRCHSYVKNGQIRYLSDCTHQLAGKTVELPTVDNW